jgi:hypothetical protein
MTGDYCNADADCCGYAGDPNPPKTYKTIHCTNHMCDNGSGCNPPGNLCGAQGQVNGSQNCCNTLPTGSGAQVCKTDANGIYRCFGGGSASCSTGWDGKDPNCCIAEGQVCQFRDQCCGGEPCVPGQDGILRCAPASSCGDSCTAACVPSAGNCTVNGDCCAGLTCQIAAGATSGTCGSAATCAQTTQSCSATVTCCSATDTCTNGVCTPPATCHVADQACSKTADCCAGLACVTPVGAACTGTGCSCQSL